LNFYLLDSKKISEYLNLLDGKLNIVNISKEYIKTTYKSDLYIQKIKRKYALVSIKKDIKKAKKVSGKKLEIISKDIISNPLIKKLYIYEDSNKIYYIHEYLLKESLFILESKTLLKKFSSMCIKDVTNDYRYKDNYLAYFQDIKPLKTDIIQPYMANCYLFEYLVKRCYNKDNMKSIYKLIVEFKFIFKKSIYDKLVSLYLSNNLDSFYLNLNHILLEDSKFFYTKKAHMISFLYNTSCCKLKRFRSKYEQI
jgi:hypothetical protein